MSSGLQAQPSSLADLDRGISLDRFATFQAAAAGDNDLARALYLWNRDLSVAFLADIAILEVALRNALHDAASRAWGTHWYSNPLVVLDDRSSSQLATAWARLPRAVQRRGSDPDVPGRLVAHCMFGFWTNLLDAGDHTGQPPRKVRVNYDDLWGAFKFAFPGGRTEARTERQAIQQESTKRSAAQTAELIRDTTFTRTWVHGICKDINSLRNRVAHHEPIINGLPLSGQGRRLSAQEAHEQCRVLARLIDRRLAAWLDTDTRVPALLRQRPGS
jgi:hypothetical protein